MALLSPLFTYGPPARLNGGPSPLSPDVRLSETVLFLCLAKPRPLQRRQSSTPKTCSHNPCMHYTAVVCMARLGERRMSVLNVPRTGWQTSSVRDAATTTAASIVHRTARSGERRSSALIKHAESGMRLRVSQPFPPLSTTLDKAVSWASVSVCVCVTLLSTTIHLQFRFSSIRSAPGPPQSCQCISLVCLSIGVATSALTQHEASNREGRLQRLNRADRHRLGRLCIELKKNPRCSSTFAIWVFEFLQHFSVLVFSINTNVHIFRVCLQRFRQSW